MNFGMTILDRDRGKLCYMDADSFVIHIITEDFNEDIANDLERWFDTSSYNENKTGKRPLPIGKSKKVIGLFKDELEGKIMEKFFVFRPKTYSYLINGYSDCCCDKEKLINKKAKETKKSVIKRTRMVKTYKDCQFSDKTILQPQQGFRSDNHEVYTRNFSKIALSSNDDKRLQTFDSVTTYPPGTNIFKAYESKMTIVRDLFVKNYLNYPFCIETILQQRLKNQQNDNMNNQF